MAAFGTTMRDEQFSISAKIWIDSPTELKGQEASELKFIYIYLSGVFLIINAEAAGTSTCLSGYEIAKKVINYSLILTWGVSFPLNFGT